MSSIFEPTADPATDGALEVRDGASITPGESKPIEVLLDADTPLHDEVATRIKRRRRLSYDHMKKRHDAWDRGDEHRRLFIDTSRGKIKADGSIDYSKLEMPFQNAIVIPESAAILDVRKTQLCSLVAGRKPMFPLQGKGPEDVKPAQIVESVLDSSVDATRGMLVLWSFFQNADAYGLGAIYDSWEEESGWTYGPPPIAALAPVLGPMAAQAAKLFPQLAERSRVWGPRRQFSRWISVDPFRFYPDPRAPVSEPWRMEFIGHGTNIGISELKLGEQPNGNYFNVDKAKDKVIQSQRNRGEGESRARARYDGDGFSLKEGIDKEDKGFYHLDHMYIRLVPKEWKIGEGDMPEIWVFSIIEDAVIVRAHPLPNEHGEFPYSPGEVNHDPHCNTNPGTLENLDGLQRYLNWHANSRMENVQRILNDRFIFSPTWLREEDMNNPSPGQNPRLTEAGEKMLLQGRVRLQDMWAQIVMPDVTGTHMEVVDFLAQYMKQVGASTDQAQGQPTESKRTLGEIQSIIAAASARTGMVARILDAMAILPLVNRSVANIQQFTDMERYVRIAGDLARESGAEQLLVKPYDLYGSYDYTPITGTSPADPSRHAETWLQVWQAALGGQQMIDQYAMQDGKALDINEIFNELCRSLGVKDTKAFYRQLQAPPQVMGDQAIAAGVQSGQMVPMEQPQAVQ